MPIDGPHILTGPIAIRGAEPGDTLEVKIVAIELSENWGYNLIRPGAGVLPRNSRTSSRESCNMFFVALLATCALPRCLTAIGEFMPWCPGN